MQLKRRGRPIIERLSEPESGAESVEIPFEAFGVRTGVVVAPPELAERVRAILPPGSRPCSASEVERTYGIVREEFGTFAFTLDGAKLNQGLELEMAIDVLDSQLRLNLGINAPDTVFIHAGVVAHGGRAVLLPGRSFAGKTTLVAALVDAGATYYSDEFAVIDEGGLVHPYARPLSIRGADRKQQHRPVEDLGGVAGSEPVAVGSVVVTRHRAGAEWHPKELTAGEGAMALVANAVAAREHPSRVMKAVSRAVEGAVVLESDRGDARAVVQPILATVGR